MNPVQGMVAIMGVAVLAGCTPLAATAVVPLGTAEAVSMTGTKKTLVDHAVSNAVGEDCSLVTLSTTGTYCQPRIVVKRPPAYCYRALGGVDCQTTPDPYRNGGAPLASPPPVIVTERDRGWIDASPAESKDGK